jgi:hypothetical protein
MKINSKHFRVREGDEDNLRKWLTDVEPVYRSKEQYHELLAEHITHPPPSTERRPEVEVGFDGRSRKVGLSLNLILFSFRPARLAFQKRLSVA